VVCGKTGRWFSLGTPLSSTSKTERNIVTEILLKQSGIKHHYHNPLTYLERQKSYGPVKLCLEEVEEDNKIRLKQYVSLRS
jgi:hypothetical protein